MKNEPDMECELVANIWPIVDATTGFIQRIAARAYAVPFGNDALISGILSALAPTDYVLAKQFPISQRFSVVSSYGKIAGTVSVQEYNHYDRTIIEPILEALAQDRPEFVGISVVRDEPQGVRPNVRFAKEPYIVTTFLIEDSEGNLIPQLSRS
jgi:hypothetical protein